MQISYITGYKAPGDKIILVETNGKEALTFRSLGEQAIAWYDNEERIYPRAKGNMGGEKVLLFLRDACHEGLVSALRIHKLAECQCGHNQQAHLHLTFCRKPRCGCERFMESAHDRVLGYLEHSEGYE